MILGMKRILFFLVSFLLLVSCEEELVSCEEDPFNAFLNQESYRPDSDWDIYPVNVHFMVTDTQGRNLFDESTPDNWLTKSFSATFDGKEFVWPSAPTKFYLATLKGFYMNPYYPIDHRATLFFGELDGLKKWDTDLCITWPDGSKDKIRVQHAIRWTKEGWPDSYTGFKVNGVPVEGDVIYLTK